jgi:hypothetical protein
LPEKEINMTQRNGNHPNTVQRVRAIRMGFSLDWWSVIVAFALALLVLSGILPQIPW